MCTCASALVIARWEEDLPGRLHWYCCGMRSILKALISCIAEFCQWRPLHHHQPHLHSELSAINKLYRAAIFVSEQCHRFIAKCIDFSKFSAKFIVNLAWILEDPAFRVQLTRTMLYTIAAISATFLKQFTVFLFTLMEDVERKRGGNVFFFRLKYFQSTPRSRQHDKRITNI